MSSGIYMAKAQKGSRRTEAASNAQALVQLIRILTEEQFDFWITCLNEATDAMVDATDASAADIDPFTPDDRQKTISYWYLLMYLLEIYSAARDPFNVKRGE